MRDRLADLALFGLYQCSVALGIALLPLAVAARRAGLSLPIDRVVAPVVDAYRGR